MSGSSPRPPTLGRNGLKTSKIHALLLETFTFWFRGRVLFVARKGREREIESQGREILAGGGGDFLLEGRGRPSVKGAGDEQLVWRRYRHGGILRRLTGDRFLDRRRPTNELRMLEEARLAGIPVAIPVGLAIEPRSALLFRSWLVTALIPGARDLLSYCRGLPDVCQAEIQSENTRLAGLFGQLIARLHAAGFDHADLQMKNLLFRNTDSKTEVFVIDFDRARRFEVLNRRRRAKNLLRLRRSFFKMCFSLARQPGSVPARFLRAYSPRDRALRRYVSHQAGKTRWKDRIHWWGWKASAKLKRSCYAEPFT